MRLLIVAAIGLTTSGCQPQTLADQYLSEMEEIGNEGATVLHVQEMSSHALVVGGEASGDPAGVSVTPYSRVDDAWVPSAMGGTSCASPAASLGFEGGYVSCGLLDPDDPTTGVSVAGEPATVLELPDGFRVWVVYSDQPGEPERHGDMP